jgi:hypothetical protein
MPLNASKQPDSLHLDLHVEISQNQGEEERKYHLVALPHPPAPPRGKHHDPPPPIDTTVAGEHTFVSWEALLAALRGICPLGDLEVLHSILLHRKKAKIGSFHLQPNDLDVLGFSARQAGPALI